MEVFRFMGMPDKVLAFDSLPENLLKGFELCRADGFPRHWKEWLGKKKKITKVSPEKDLLTGNVRYYDPIVEEDSYFYLVDWNLNQNDEQWKEVCNYVKKMAPKDFRLTDDLTELAKPLANNKTDGVSLEPEDVIVIPLVKESQTLTELPSKVPALKDSKESILACSECNRAFEGPYGKNALRMHMMKHKKEKVVA